MSAGARRAGGVFCGVLLALALAAPAAARQAELGGSWVRDDARGSGTYWSGEYPGMTLEISVSEGALSVQQALGNVRDGVAQPGSGDTLLEYSLILDGRQRDIPAPRGTQRQSAAEWRDGALRVTTTLTLRGGEGQVTMRETWRVLDGGATLQIEREADLPGVGTRRSTVIFARR